MSPRAIAMCVAVGSDGRDVTALKVPMKTPVLLYKSGARGGLNCMGFST